MKALTGGIRILAVCVGLAALSGCRLPVVETGHPALTFAHLSPIHLQVSEVVVDKAYEPSYNAPHIELQFPVPPHEAVQRWVDDRLRADGTAQRLFRVRVEEASVKEYPLTIREGISDLFYNEPSERVEIILKVSFALLDGTRVLPVREATVTVERQRTIQENTSLAEREAIYVQMTERLMQAFNQEAERQMQLHFSPYLH